MSDADAADAGTTARHFGLGSFGPAPSVVAGRYELGERLGEGATARVHRAHDRVLNRTVAVKLFHPGTVELGRDRRAQEVQALQALRHPGLVRLYAAGTDEGHAYLVMQLAEGPNLASRLRGGPLPAGEVTELGAQLAEALAHVHAHHVTHRDLKPANILLTGGQALIADFGVARLVDATRVTASGATVGTAAYLAPEQVLGEHPGAPADVYALGLVLLECLTGAREYEGTPAESAVVRLHRQPHVPDDLPEGLASTLRAMTAREPEQRPTAAAVTRALRGDAGEARAFAGLPGGESGSGGRTRSTRTRLFAEPWRRLLTGSRRRRLAVFASVATVPVVLAAVGAALLLNLTTADPPDDAGLEPPPAPTVNAPGVALPAPPIPPTGTPHRPPMARGQADHKARHQARRWPSGPGPRHHGKAPRRR
ncbi:protein kinase domain-containing protein [Amycolatopsis sp. PS_44_ISF1]|uniref:serine/threonine-protein kinase n=1 Tax=Amycolatopsis sp. PS_44_ISF1 TaxID=2974917 RepID=UPI0028DFCE29|nr:protein kinase [Amycolatopsis sp. PS_44_ISF1]MDT8914514.1 protein kinase [Amycolatopsis sp. PS_44_ISF1]